MEKSHSDQPFPNVDAWQPRQIAKDTVRHAFYTRCEQIEAALLLAASAEQQMNIDNYDSGLGLEDLVRHELEKVLQAATPFGLASCQIVSGAPQATVIF